MKQMTLENFAKNHDPEQIALESLLVRLMEWSKDKAPAYFDESWIHEMYIRYHEGRGLTPRQVNGLKNISTKFSV